MIAVASATSSSRRYTPQIPSLITTATKKRFTEMPSFYIRNDFIYRHHHVAARAAVRGRMGCDSPPARSSCVLRMRCGSRAQGQQRPCKHQRSAMSVSHGWPWLHCCGNGLPSAMTPEAQLMSRVRWRTTSNFTLLRRSNNVWPHVLTKHQNVSGGAPLFYRCEVECVGRKPQPVFAGADNSDTLVSFPSLEASSICYIFILWGSFEETPLSVSRQVTLTTNAVSFVKSPRRSRTAFLDAGPRGTFVTYLQALGIPRG
jgi:hypothetical protein